MSNKPVHLTPKAGLLNNIEVFERPWLLEIIWKLLAQVTGALCAFRGDSMTFETEILARKFWEDKKHFEAVRVGLEQLSIEEVGSKEEFSSLFLNLTYSLFSASEVKLYDDFINIFVRYMSIINRAIDEEPPIGYHNHACLMQHNLMATIFKYYIGECDLNDIEEANALVKFWSDRAGNPENLNDANAKLLKLSHLILDSKHPYYVVSFRLPFALPVPNGKYSLAAIGNVKTIRLESREYADLTSVIGDRHFSVVEVKVKGFTSTDNYWQGPSLDCLEKPFNLDICLKTLNEIILRTKLIKEGLRLKTISHQDIGRSTTVQYNREGEEFHSTISFGFGGDSLVDVLSKQELEEHEIEVLLKQLSASKLNLHEELFAEALIEEANANLTSAFYLLNSSCEALIEYSAFRVAEKKGRIEEYKAFMQGKSFCLECDLFKSNYSNFEPPKKTMPPSLFTQLKFFKVIGIASNKELREIRKCLCKIRNDNLRNSLIHGRTNEIPRNAVSDAIEGYKLLKGMLNKVAD